MKFISAALLVAVFGAAFAAPSETELKTTSRTPAEIAKLVAAAGGCNVNLCFALDGSGSVTEGQFKNQKNFVLDVIAAIAGNPMEVAAVQYGKFNRPISFITADLDSFVDDIDNAEFIADSRTNVGGGIVWCGRQLRKRPGEALKMVVMGDGRNNLGGSPATRARRFRNVTGGKVCAVGIGFNRNIQRLTNIVGGDSSLVLTVQEYFELADILEELVEQICDITLN